MIKYYLKLKVYLSIYSNYLLIFLIFINIHCFLIKTSFIAIIRANHIKLGRILNE